MTQNVLRYNVAFVGRFFSRGSWVSEVWRKEHPEEFADETDGPPERIETTEDRRVLMNLDTDLVGVVCVRSSDMQPPHGVRLMSAERGTRTYKIRGPINNNVSIK